MIVPRAVVFDLGKVLLDFDYGIAARKIASRSQRPPAEIQRLIDQSALLFRYETGLVTRDQFYREICGASGFGGSIDEFSGFFADVFVAIEPMVELHEELRQRRIPTYVFSNTNELAVSHVRRNFPFFSNFDGYIFSYEHGVMKPDERLYEVVEKESGRRGAEILYLDDRPENIAAGVARGWQIILHHSPEESRKTIQRLGLLGQD